MSFIGCGKVFRTQLPSEERSTFLKRLSDNAANINIIAPRIPAPAITIATTFTMTQIASRRFALQCGQRNLSFIPTKLVYFSCSLLFSSYRWG